MDGSYPGVPAVEMGRSPWYTAGARKNRSLLPNPKPAPLKHRAELLLEAGLRRWVLGKDTLQEQVKGIQERTGRFQQARPSTQGDVGSGSLGCRWGKG